VDARHKAWHDGGNDADSESPAQAGITV